VLFLYRTVLVLRTLDSQGQLLSHILRYTSLSAEQTSRIIPQGIKLMRRRGDSDDGVRAFCDHKAFDEVVVFS